MGTSCRKASALAVPLVPFVKINKIEFSRAVHESFLISALAAAVNIPLSPKQLPQALKREKRRFRFDGTAKADALPYNRSFRNGMAKAVPFPTPQYILPS
jgi:hypothetical protein